MTPPSTLRHRGEVRCRRAHSPRPPWPDPDERHRGPVGTTERGTIAAVRRDSRAPSAGSPAGWSGTARAEGRRSARVPTVRGLVGERARVPDDNLVTAGRQTVLALVQPQLVMRYCRSRCDKARWSPTGDPSPQLVAWGQPTARRPGRASRRFCSLWNSTTVSPRSFGCRVGNSRKRPASAPRSYQRSISASVSPRSTRRSRPVGSTVTAPPVLSRRQAVGVPILGVGGPWVQGRRWDDSARRPYGWMDTWLSSRRPHQRYGPHLPMTFSRLVARRSRPAPAVR